MPQGDMWDVVFKRDDLSASEVLHAEAPALRPGEVRLALEKCGLTTNNATYARFGDSDIPFWNAFPGPPGYGRVPVWGFVRVAESRHPDIRPGSRYFGYVPMSTHHTVAPAPWPRGFFDSTAQRDFLHPWYRTFQPADEADELDDVRALMRPVFPAAFHLADLVAAEAGRGARSVLLTSASAKVAIGLLSELAARGVRIPAVGLTSAQHVPFVEKLGLYDSVAAYDDFGSVDVTAPAVFIDLTGAARWRRGVHDRLHDRLSRSVHVGFTHPDATIAPPALPGPEPEVFFTPAVEDQAVAAEGVAGYHARYHAAEERFLRSMSSWLTIRHGRGPEGFVDALRSLLAGDAAPSTGHVVTP